MDTGIRFSRGVGRRGEGRRGEGRRGEGRGGSLLRMYFQKLSQDSDAWLSMGT